MRFVEVYFMKMREIKFKDYYDRTAAGRDIVIDTLSKDKRCQRVDLLAAVNMKCGLGGRWLDELLHLLEKMERVSIADDVITWRELVKKK